MEQFSDFTRRRVVTVEMAMEIARVDKRTIYRLIKSKKLETQKEGRFHLVFLDTLFRNSDGSLLTREQLDAYGLI